MSAPRPTRAAKTSALATTIDVTRFPSLTDPIGEKDSYAEWNEFAADFETNYDIIANKSEGQGWSPAIFKDDKRAKKNVERVCCLVLDYDAGTTPIQTAFDFWSWEAFAVFRQSPFTTACLLHTSFSHTAEHPKFRVVMPFSRPVDAGEFEVIWTWIADLAEKAGHKIDQSCKDPSRMWFCPAGKPGEPPTFRIHDEGADPIDVKRILKDCGYRATTTARLARTDTGATLSLAPRTFDRGIEEVRSAASGTRNGTLNRVAFTAGMAIGAGRLDEARARDELREAGLACGLDPNEVDTTIDGAIHRGKQNPSTSRWGDRPEVKLDMELHEQVDGAMLALSTHDNLFQKDGRLVSIDERSGELIALDDYRVQEMMSECAEWLDYSAKDGSYKRKNVPPKRLAEHIAKRQRWQHIRSLRAVTAFPVLDAKGNLHVASGYGGATQTFYAGSLPIRMPDAPTLHDAKAATGALLDVVCDFPFVDETHKSAWLAALLSPLSRFMHEGNIPLVVIQANDRRVGKSKLAGIIASIVTGKAPATMTHVANGDEERKRIGSILLAGHPVVMIDNVESQFGGQNMNALITSRVYEDRFLGRNAILRAENNATWIVNGKNMTLAPDMAQRSLHIRLQCNDEKPELRDGFKYSDLEATVLERRADLLGAALTILRAYVIAGMPPQKLPAWGSFEPWSRLVRGALVWAGMPDPALTRDELEEEADTELSFEVGLIEGWSEAERSLNSFTGLTANEVLKHLEANPPSVCPILREALVRITPLKCALPGPNKLGHALGAIKRKIRSGKMIERAGSGKDACRWYVVTVPPPSP